MEWSCTIPGTPVGKGRPRFCRSKVGRPMAYTPERTRSWESVAASIMRDAWGKDTPSLSTRCTLDVEAVFQRTVLLNRAKIPPDRVAHTVRPDWDNVGKIVSDSLQLARVIADDARIVDARVRKFYAAKGEAAHVRVVVTCE